MFKTSQSKGRKPRPNGKDPSGKALFNLMPNVRIKYSKPKLIGKIHNIEEWIKAFQKVRAGTHY